MMMMTISNSMRVKPPTEVTLLFFIVLSPTATRCSKAKPAAASCNHRLGSVSAAARQTQGVP